MRRNTIALVVRDKAGSRRKSAGCPARSGGALEYRGYTMGPIDFDADDRTFSGVVAGLRAVVHFEGTTADELLQAFRDSVDDYIDFCRERGEEPERPFKGNILVRTDPELHRKAALRAAEAGISLNEWISRRIAQAV